MNGAPAEPHEEYEEWERESMKEIQTAPTNVMAAGPPLRDRPDAIASTGKTGGPGRLFLLRGPRESSRAGEKSHCAHPAFAVPYRIPLLLRRGFSSGLLCPEGGAS